jgi:O-antigen ligase
MRATTSSSIEILTLVVAAGAAVSGAYLLAQAPSNLALLLAAGLIIGVMAFLRTQLAILLLIVAMLLSPELNIGSTTGASMGRGITIRLDDLLLLIVGLAWFLKTALYKELNLLQSTPINGAVFLYALSCIVPTLVGMQAGRVDFTTGSLFLLKYLEYLVLFWMVVNNTTNERQVRQYLLLLFVVAIIVGCVAILQIPSGNRVSAPFEGAKGEPNTLGGYLVFIIALLLGIACVSQRYWKPALLVIALLTVPFLFTLSRSSYVAFLPMVMVVLLLTKKRMLLALLVAGMLLLLLFPSLLPKAVVDRIGYTLDQPYHKDQAVVMGHRLDTSTSARLESMAQAWNAFQEKPLLGWGITGWHFIDSQYPRQLVETGLLGLAAFLFLVTAVLRSAWRSMQRLRAHDLEYYGVACGFIGGTAGLVVHSLGANSFIIVRIMEPFWLVCALVLVLPGILEAKQNTMEENALPPA